MKYVNLGRSGLKVSRLCLGCMSYGEPERLPQPWSLDEKASRPLIRQALEAGINFFDTANIYSGGSSEEITGKALREMARRDEIVEHLSTAISALDFSLSDAEITELEARYLPHPVDGIIPPLPDTPPSLTPPSAIQNY
ncbi:aldo/keto reductase [Klebsiella pneumoniae]|uniref:aldo/keto reductase n=1 Tax=Klebsiella pneumoniae TaxID=573 RepID=UPI001082AD86|nr:aldo/keto reductase [Klebsiella pneumoniae]EIW9305924.1 aldo/keto reductase [Klebsiella pneumoniae]VGA93166.1 oxidoreductase [Klebsiella pneumoniae]VGB36170.1 oxidoreductase [Klebsiella pneumoniae]